MSELKKEEDGEKDEDVEEEREAIDEGGEEGVVFFKYAA